MRFAWLGAGAALSLIVAAGCSTSGDRAERVGAQKQRIQGGDLATTHTFAVGVASSGGGICSGALIAPNVVVTARHCVQSIDYNDPEVPNTIDCKLNPTFVGPVKSMSITTSAVMDGNAQYRSVKQVALPQVNAVCGNDIALLVLTNVVPANVATPIIPGVQYPINYSKYLSSFTAIGYGGTNANGAGLGTRRQRQLIRIACIPGDPNIPCPPDFPEGDFVAGDGPCGGDSGSSAYEQNTFTFGTAVSFGVLSRGGEDGTTCVGSVYTRLDKFRDLVINTVKTASNNWTLYPEPSWTTYVPPEEKDAGGPAADGGKPTTKPSGGAFGETCAEDTECSSKVCGAEGACTTICEDSSTCPEGYDCRDSQCLTAAAAPAEAAPATTTKTTESCSTPGGSTGAPWGTLLLASAVALGLGARRRRTA